MDASIQQNIGLLFFNTESIQKQAGGLLVPYCMHVFVLIWFIINLKFYWSLINLDTFTNWSFNFLKWSKIELAIIFRVLCIHIENQLLVGSYTFLAFSISDLAVTGEVNLQTLFVRIKFVKYCFHFFMTAPLSYT